MGKRQAGEQDGAHGAEDERVHADTERHHHDHGEREAGGAAQRAERVAEVLEHRVHGNYSRGAGFGAAVRQRPRFSSTTRPSNSGMGRWAYRETGGRCVPRQIVEPCGCRSRSRSIPASPFVESRFPVGSSASRISGSPASARATATRCCWPPESWLGRCFERCAMLTRSRASPTRRLRSTAAMPREVSGSSTFSCTERSPIRLKLWKMNPISRFRIRARSVKPRLWTGLPSSQYWPSVAVSSRPRIESSVDLPQPEGPEIDTYSPRWISMCTPESACVST